MDSASRLEQGIFGLRNVKLGVDAKEQGVMLHSMSCFRRAALAVLVALTLAVSCVMCYGWKIARTGRELEDADLKRSAAECGSIVETILLKQDEIEELARRLQQRELFDVFLDAEKEVEEALRMRIERLVQAGPESTERKRELQDAFGNELQWFMDAVDAKVEDIIGPLDAAFQDVPKQIHDLQSEIRVALPAFHPKAVCQRMELVVGTAKWRPILEGRIDQMIEGVHNEAEQLQTRKLGKEQHPQRAALIHHVLDLVRAVDGPHKETSGAAMRCSAEVVASLLRWYSEMDVRSLVHHRYLSPLATLDARRSS
mmetsp:Transcript_82404/g.229580  ORF Transcript_82404/g.229580 Transcript_82404/m.229580 type:complete len:313 (-) Transcript_82404:85-1023(-)